MTTLAIFTGVAIDSSGNAISGADVEVRLESTGVLASIYSDEAGTTPLANPATALTDSSGRFSFYIAGANRGYSVKVTKSADTYTLHNQAIGTGGQLDQASFILTADVLNAAADGKSVVLDSTQTKGFNFTDNPGRPNLLINPNWQIDQINEGALYTVNTTDVRGPDGWSGDAVGAGVFKLRTLADPDNAALKCLEISCTTADGSIAATDRYEVWTAVEGYDAAALMLGTASAGSYLYQFKLKSNSVTGVFGVYFANSAGNRFYAGTITIPDTGEHEYTVKVAAGDTTGTWLYTNGIGLRMGLVLAAGSNFQGTAGAWTGSTVKTTSSQANFMSTNTNIIYLKRCHLIQGSLVQAYRPADIQKELARAQRYYEKTYDQGASVGTTTSLGAIRAQITISANNFTVMSSPWAFKTTKRSTPTVTGYSDATGTSGKFRDLTAGADINAAFNETGQTGTQLQFNVTGSSTAVARGQVTADARLS